MADWKETGGDVSNRILWDVACRRMKKQLPESVMKEWIAHFSLLELTDEKAVIAYKGKRNLELFRERYLESFQKCLFWALEREVVVELRSIHEIRKSNDETNAEDRNGKRRKPDAPGKRQKAPGTHQRGSRCGKRRILDFAFLILFIVAVGIIFLVVNHAGNGSFTEAFYQIGSGKISRNMRVIQISDLHASSFGGNNSVLVSRITELEPDLIVLTGDFVEESTGDAEVTLTLCRQLAEIAPVYFIYGNHETMASFDYNDMSLDEIDTLLGCDANSRSSEGFWEMKDELKDSLEETGVKVLWNEYETITVGTDKIDVYGVLTAHPYAFWQYAEETYVKFRYENTDHFKLMLCHEPYIYETWDGDGWADLSLAGHTHGGGIRLPYFGGLYEYRYGLLPEFGKKNHMVSGKYDVEGKPVIISNGMSSNDWLRINNPPQLVIVDINRY